MITSKIQKLAAAKETVARLESEIEAELQSELASLHENYGFADVETFIVAVNEAAGGGTVRKRHKKRSTLMKSRTRTTITETIRARVKKLVQAGKSGSSIANAMGISLPSVQNIKKALGLVKRRGPKKKTPKKHRAQKTTVKKAPAAVQAAAPAAEKSESAATLSPKYQGVGS